ncbi:MAG: S8 family serine peptidase [Acidobacteria bacterium]|nr:S8 family serine peptidase [Acidobacteriota bacterium]
MGNRVKRSNRSNIKWQEKSNSQNSLVKLIPELAALWAETHGNSTVTIALLDGTVDITHPCFVGTNLRKINTINTTSGNDLALEHGTNIASILFANSNKLMQGIVPGCRGLILPIYAESNKKILPCSQLDLARAINQALDAGANIINISGGQFEPSGEAEVYLAKAIKTCIDNKVLVISAAGNNGCNCHHVPASIPGVIAVGAMNLQGKPTEFSNWGRKYQQNGILAPGKDIPTASLGGGVNLKSGTSYAAAIVTGIAALMLSLQIKRGQKLSTYKVKDATGAYTPDFINDVLITLISIKT